MKPIKSMSELVRRAAAKVEDEPIQLARKAGTPGTDAEGNPGVWVQIDTGPLFIRKGETAKTAFVRKQKYVERGGFFGPGHKETKRAYNRTWRESQGDPVMRDVVQKAGLTKAVNTAKDFLEIGSAVKGAVYQEIISKRKMSKLQTRLRNLGEKLKGSVKGSDAYKKVVKMRDIYRRLAIRYSKVRRPVKRTIAKLIPEAEAPEGQTVEITTGQEE